MKLSLRQLCTLVLMSLACVDTQAASAQTREGRATRAGANQVTGKSKAEDARRKREAREAVAALREAGEAARSFDDSFEKVRVQAEVADILWAFDEQAARAILRRAWEATTAPGAVKAFRWEDESVDDGVEKVIMARRIVITRAIRHDPGLAESYMRDFGQGLSGIGGESSGSSTNEEGTQSQRDVWRQPSFESYQRFQAAYGLLSKGDYKSAAAIIAPAVSEGISRYLLDLIKYIRDFDAGVADELYLRLLERTRSDAAANANDVLLLSSPIVSPNLRVYINADGSTTFLPLPAGDNESQGGATPVPPRVRGAFFNMAAAVLLRASQGRSSTEKAGGDALALYFAIGRLLPFFEREAPQYAPQLHARMSALSQEIAEARRNAASAQMQTRSLNPKNPTDPLGSYLAKLASATDERERDRLRFDAVSIAAGRKLWDRARQLSEEISDAGARSEAHALIVTSQVIGLSEAFKDKDATDDFERAAAFVRAADVPAAVRALGFAQAAELAALKGKSGRASQLLDEASLAAGQVDRRTKLRVITLGVLVDTAADFSEQSAWELLPQLVAAINEFEDDETGEGCAGGSIDGPYGSVCVPFPEHALESEQVFAKMGRLDFARLLAEARTLRDEVMRADVLVEAARALLKKNVAAPSKGAR